MLRKGLFNVSSPDNPWQIIPTAWIKLAQARSETGKRPVTPLDAIGVDPARGGADATAIARRWGLWFEVEKHRGETTPTGGHVAGLVAPLFESSALINVDAIGVGASALDSMLSHGLPAIALNGAEASKARDRSGKFGFVNRRAQWWWQLREALDPERGEAIALPPGGEILGDLSAPRWQLTRRGIQVEDKEQIKKRIGRSPDCGEAILYAAVLPGDRRRSAGDGLKLW
jgi:hypothetical protein